MCCNYTTKTTCLPDDVLALGVVLSLVGLLGVLGAHLVVLGVALFVGDLPRDGVAVLQVGGLALGVIVGLVLGLVVCVALLVVSGSALLGVDSLVLGTALDCMAVAVGSSRACGNQSREQDEEGQLKYESKIVTIMNH
jgi:hypothetical protein